MILTSRYVTYVICETGHNSTIQNPQNKVGLKKDFNKKLIASLEGHKSTMVAPIYKKLGTAVLLVTRGVKDMHSCDKKSFASCCKQR